MKITRNQLLRIIKEELLQEVGPGVGMDPTGATMPKGMKRSEYNQLETADSEAFRIVMSIIDPTGVLSIPDVPPALDAFEKNKTLINALFLVLAVVAVVPVAGTAAKGAQRLVAATKSAKNIISRSPTIKASAPENFWKSLDDAIDKAQEIQKAEIAGQTAPPPPKKANLDGENPKQKQIKHPGGPFEPRRLESVASHLGLSDMKYVDAGQDAATYIAKLDNPIGKHKEVAVKVMKGGVYMQRNLRNARWVLNNRASLPESVRKYLPEVLDVGETSDGLAYTVVEKLDPLPKQITSSFGVPPSAQISKIIKDPDRFSVYADFFVAAASKDLMLLKVRSGQTSRPMLSPSGKRDIKSSIMKYYNNPDSISSSAREIVKKINMNKVGHTPAQREGFKKTIPGFIDYVVDLKNATNTRIINLESALNKWENSGSGALEAFAKAESWIRELDIEKARVAALDDYIEKIGTAEFWMKAPDNLSASEWQAAKNTGKYQSGLWLPMMKKKVDEIPDTLGIHLGTGEAVHPSYTRDIIHQDPMVRKITDAMKDMKKAGFEPFDLHVDNWMIRPGTGDIVMSDFGRFIRQSLEESKKIDTYRWQQIAGV